MQVEAIYSPTIMDGPVVRLQTGFKRGTYKDIFSGKDRTDWSAEISASRNGVSIQGAWSTYRSAADIEQIKNLLDLAWSAFAQITSNSDPHAAATKFVDEFNASEQSLRLVS